MALNFSGFRLLFCVFLLYLDLHQVSWRPPLISMRKQKVSPEFQRPIHYSRNLHPTLFRIKYARTYTKGIFFSPFVVFSFPNWAFDVEEESILKDIPRRLQNLVLFMTNVKQNRSCRIRWCHQFVDGILENNCKEAKSV